MARTEERVLELFGDLREDLDLQSTPTSQAKAVVPVYDDDFDIVGLMNSAKDPDTGLMRDLKIDDGDLHHASSFYDYCFNVIKEDAHPPWIFQMWIALMAFGEVCPVCSSKKWLSLDWMAENVSPGTPPEDLADHLVMLRHGVCPKCERTKYELIKGHGLNNYVELVNVLGQRSGKSALAANMSTYVMHRHLKFPRLSSMTKAMQKSTELTATFVSLNFNKAYSLLWTPYQNIISESRWWQELHKILDHSTERYGVELYRKRSEFTKYFYKGIRIYPAGPKSQILRGDTRFLSVLDELGLFPLPTGNDEEDEKSERANADEAHKSLLNSLGTVQGVVLELLKRGHNPPPALLMGVSSPISMKDKVMRLLAESRTREGKKLILGVNLPTWKVNPYMGKDNPIIVKAYASNAEKAERDFGASPPRVSQSYMKASQIPLELFKHKNTHILSYQYDKPGLIYGKLQRVWRPKYPSVVTIDAGHVNNSFSLTGGHFDFDTHKTVISTVLEIMVHDGREVDFNSVYLNVILPVLIDLNAVLLIADQWQSIDLLSRAREDRGKAPNGKLKTATTKYSPRRASFDSLVSMITNGTMEFPYLSPEDYKDVCENYIDYTTLKTQAMKHLFLQMLTVRDEGPSKTPTKGEGFTDDTFRALVLQTKIHDPKVMERLREARAWVDAEGARGTSPAPRYVSRG